MLKKFSLWLILMFFALPNMAQSIDKSNPGRYMNTSNDFTGGFFWHPRGLGMSFKSSKKIHDQTWRVINFDLISMRHEKERRIRSSSFSAPGSFFFGKLNYVYFLRMNYGRRWDLGQHLYKNTLATRVGFSVGPTLAFLKPVYLEIYHPGPDQASGYLVSERYNPAVHNDPSIIFGTSPITKGLLQTKLRAGLSAKAYIEFDWSDYYDQIQSLEFGIAIDAFGRNIPILAFAQNKNVFTSLYICLNIGNRW
ncbi:MAG: hypothetical protein GC180_02980 [Bacteroidetes bacterium]|nr:hypothetical protein [Bacteroidota bacterium]